MTGTHTSITGITATPAQVGTKYIRWGLGLFIFGLVIGYGPWLHYMHGALEEVHEAFLKNVTLWFGCPWTLPVYVTQLGGLSMVVIGLCYLAFVRNGAMASISGAERMGPALCAAGQRWPCCSGTSSSVEASHSWGNLRKRGGTATWGANTRP